MKWEPEKIEECSRRNMRAGCTRALLLLLLALPNVAPFAAPFVRLATAPRLSAPGQLAAPRLAGQPSARSACARPGAAALEMAAAKSKLAKALIKSTGALTVSVTMSVPDRKLSKPLRKQCKVAAIFATADALPAIAEEQMSARGDFPGPLPVVLRDEAELLSGALAGAKKSGAAGVVVPLGALGSAGASELAAAAAALELEVVWEVHSQEEYAEAAAAGAAAFLVSAVEDSFGVAPAFWAGVDKGALVLAEVKGQQEGNSEIGLGRALKEAGCRALLLSGVCATGEKDKNYVAAAARALTSKASTEFAFQGGLGTASAIGIGHGMSTATKEPTIVKEVIDHNHLH
jgi:hypothetical protein